MNSTEELECLSLSQLQYVLIRHYRNDLESVDATTEKVEKKYATKEAAIKRVKELIESGSRITKERVRFINIFENNDFKEISEDTDLLDEVITTFELETDILNKEKIEAAIFEIIDGGPKKDEILSFMYEAVLNELDDDEIEDEHINLYLEGQLLFLIYRLLTEESTDLYSRIKEYIKAPANKFAVVVEPNDYEKLEVVRVMLSLFQGKSMNNTVLFKTVLNAYYNKLQIRPEFKLVRAVVSKEIGSFKDS